MKLFDKMKKNKRINRDNNEVIVKTTYSTIERENDLNPKVKNNLKVAYQYGEKLKSFNSQEDAKEYFYDYRVHLSNKLKLICKNQSYFLPDYTVESLKVLEKWYFDLLENDSFDTLGVDRHEFEDMMSIYFGEVVIKNNTDAQWEVIKYPFGLAQAKYEFMISKNLLSMSIEKSCRDWYTEINNKRHNLLFRRYNHYFK